MPKTRFTASAEKKGGDYNYNSASYADHLMKMNNIGKLPPKELLPVDETARPVRVKIPLNKGKNRD